MTAGVSARPGICLASLLADHARTDPEEMAGAIRSAASAESREVSLFAAHAAAAVPDLGGHPRGDPALGPRDGASDLVSALISQHRRAGVLLAEGCLDPLRAQLTSEGLTVAVLEFACAWARGEVAVIEDEVTALAQVAVALGAPRVLAVCVDQTVDPARAVRGLARTADIAAEHGLRVCVEFAAIFAVSRLEDVIHLLDRADRPNLGLVIDTFHWRRQPGGPDPAVLSRIDPGCVDFVQVAGAAPGSGENLGANFARAMPDEDTELRPLLQAIADTGARPFVASEVFDHARLERMGQAEFARSVTDRVTTVTDGVGLTASGTLQTDGHEIEKGTLR